MQLTKIVEGGIDLITGQQLEAGIVVSNGCREITVPVSSDSMEKLAHLYADKVMRLDKGKEAAPEPLPNRDDIPEHNTEIHGPVFVPAIDDVEKPIAPVSVFTDEDYTAPPVSTDTTEDDGFEPGEDYDDSGTGVGSL